MVAYSKGTVLSTNGSKVGHCSRESDIRCKDTHFGWGIFVRTSSKRAFLSWVSWNWNWIIIVVDYQSCLRYCWKKLWTTITHTGGYKKDQYIAFLPFYYLPICGIVAFSTFLSSAMFFMYYGCPLANMYFARPVILDHYMCVIVFSWDYNFECLWSDNLQYRIRGAAHE